MTGAAKVPWTGRWPAAAWTCAAFLGADAATKGLAPWPSWVSVIGAFAFGCAALAPRVLRRSAPTIEGTHRAGVRLDDAQRLLRARQWIRRLYLYAVPHTNFPAASNPVAVTNDVVANRIEAKADRFFRAAFHAPVLIAWASDVEYARRGDDARDRIDRLAHAIGGWIVKVEAANLARDWDGEWPGDDPPPDVPEEPEA